MSDRKGIFIPPFSTLVEMLRSWTERQGELALYTFLVDGDSKGKTYSYQDLERVARRIGAFLQKGGFQGERALLLYEPGLDYIAAFFGCLFAGVIAVPAYPPDPYRLMRTLPRLKAILKDSQAKLILTTEDIRSLSQTVFEQDPEFKSLQWQATDLLQVDLEKDWREPAIGKDSLAFLQYTSGSTGIPKGVMLSHGNLLSNLKLIYEAFEIPDYTAGKGVSWLPPYHDMGLIGGILEPLYSGTSTVLMSPLMFLQKPYLWLKAISQNRGMISGGPNFAYEMCVQKITPEQRGTLDLSHWKLAFTGAEPIRAATLDRFAEYFAPAGFRREAFYPCYGLAEGTLLVSGGKKSELPVVKRFSRIDLKEHRAIPSAAGEEEAKEFVGCGRNLPLQSIRIVDPETFKSCEEGRVGEIWVSGPSVAQGYWKREELSEKVFRARIGREETGNERREMKDGDLDKNFLRTGDLGFFQEGELFVTDRLKDLIIIRGQNHYPHDLELTVEKAHPSLRAGCGAAFSVEEGGEERLVIVQELERTALFNDPSLNLEKVVQEIRQAVAEHHEVELSAVALIKAGTIPKTSSGKISRFSCREGFWEGSLELLHQSKKESAPQENGSGPKGLSTLTQKPKKAEELEEWMIDQVSERMNVAPETIDPRQALTRYGLDSKELVGLSGDLEVFLGRSLSPTLLWQYPSIEALALHLSGESSSSPQETKTPKSLSSEEPIAVIGMSCRFPKAEDPESFWKLLSQGIDGVSEVSPKRWEVDRFYSAEPATKGKMNTRWGGFLDSVDGFDAKFFGVSPREASRMDPQQRLLMEVSWEAFEGAGISAEKLTGSSTGVFVGISSSDYSKFQWGDLQLIDAYAGTGNAHSIAANRLSYLFDLRGPSMAVDTACSSSLVAVHLACQSLRRGESALALAGGVNLILSPEVTIAFSQARMMSSKGRCATFDDEADGYVRGEGAGAVVLKRLSEAVKDGDPILAIIRGSAINQDGRSNGLTAPNGLSQQEVIRAALSEAGFAASEIGYVEAHGTGTPLGDPIEIEALGAVLKEGRDLKVPCAVGSVKTNIGHLEAAAGIAGMIKVILSLQKKEIPPHLHLKKINRHIPLDSLPIEIPSDLRAWTPISSKRIAGVSSFGFGGTNAHVIVEEAPFPLPPPSRGGGEGEGDRSFHLLKLSAPTESGLRLLAGRFKSHFTDHPSLDLADVCFSLNTGRNSFDHRMWVSADSLESLKEKIGGFAEGKNPEGLRYASLQNRKSPKIAFLFTGQGSQYAGMARELYGTQPSFREIVDRGDEILRGLWGRQESGVRSQELGLLDVLFPKPENESRIHKTGFTQPALYVVEYALAQLIQSWGIKPQGVMGHSVGEYVAACLAGVFSFEEGLRLIAARASLMQSLPKGGKMLAVVAEEDKVAALLTPFQKEVSLAAINGPRSVVVSGHGEAIDRFEKECRAQGITTQGLTVSHAFHSPLMDPILENFKAEAAKVKFEPPRLDLVSNLTGTLFEAGEKPDANYWKDHLRQAVRFSKGIESLVNAGYETFVEIGPHSVLTGLAKKCVNSPKLQWLSTLQKGKNDWEGLCRSLGELSLQGFKIDWVAWDRNYSRQKLSLPTTPFERERYWVEESPKKSSASRSSFSRIPEGVMEHPWLGVPLSTALASRGDLKSRVFENIIDLTRFPFLKDHRVQGEAIFPASGYVEMGLEAVGEGDRGQGTGDGKKEEGSQESGRRVIKDLIFEQALFLDEKSSRNIQVILTPQGAQESTFQVFSQSEKESSSWISHCRGRIGAFGEEGLGGKKVSLEGIKTNLPQEIASPDFYQELKKSGLEYGPAFQGVQKIYRRDGEALGLVELPEDLEAGVASCLLHPALLDAAFQVLAAALPLSFSGQTFVPTRIDRFSMVQKTPPKIWSHAVLKPSPEMKVGMVSDIFLYDEDGQLLAEIQNLSLMPLELHFEGGDKKSKSDSWVYEWEWQEDSRPIPSSENGNVGEAPWLIVGGEGDLAQTLASTLESKGAKIRVINGADPGELRDYQGVISLIGVSEAKTSRSIPERAQDNSLHLLRLVQSLAGTSGSKFPRFWIVTKGVQAIGSESLSLESSPLWGLGQVVALEHPELKTVRVDLSQNPSPEETEALSLEVLSPTVEDQIALRGSKRWVPRWIRSSNVSHPQEKMAPEKTTVKIGPQDPFRLEIVASGTLEGARLRKTERPDPGPGEVEIQVEAAGLNFSDVLKVLGLYPGLSAGPVPIGVECSGRVVRVGPEVKDFQIGDEVIAVAPFCFGRYAKTHSLMTVPKPKHLTFAEAATIPITFLTSYYALHYLGRIQKGEKVLIHAGAGGVGLAAIQIAQAAGAEIFATAGSEEKREFLRSLGVSHVMDSRTLSFEREILHATGGKGVDLVLNSLPGDFIHKSLSLLAPYGRFFEIGKTDIYQDTRMGLLPFQKNLSYFAIDLDRMFRERTHFVHSLFLELIQLFENGRLKPLPHQDFSVESVEGAFRYMAQRKNIGKVVVTIPSKDLEVEEAAVKPEIRPDAFYLITGGLGDLGLSVAGGLVERGAKHLLLIGRKAPSPKAASQIAEWKAKGVEVEVVSADISKKVELSNVLSPLQKRSAPLRGIFHCAGVLEDAFLLHQNPEKISKVFSPKVQGGWNLHELTQETPLDFFVLFSSVASVLGSPGQGNYAAANRFLDALAEERTRLGKPSLSINWGPWAEIGMAARTKTTGHLDQSGLKPLPPTEAMRVLETLLFRSGAKGVLDVDWGKLKSTYPAPHVSFLSKNFEGEETLATAKEESKALDSNFREALLKLPAGERQEALEDHIQGRVARVLGMEVGKLDRKQSLNTIGLDSLMAIELKNEIEIALGIALSMATLIRGPSIQELALQVLGQIEGSSEAAPLQAKISLAMEPTTA